MLADTERKPSAALVAAAEWCKAGLASGRISDPADPDDAWLEDLASGATAL